MLMGENDQHESCQRCCSQLVTILSSQSWRKEFQSQGEIQRESVSRQSSATTTTLSRLLLYYVVLKKKKRNQQDHHWLSRACCNDPCCLLIELFTTHDGVTGIAKSFRWQSGSIPIWYCRSPTFFLPPVCGLSSAPHLETIYFGKNHTDDCFF